MATLAELKLIVDSSQLEHAKKVLDEFGVSASNVESSSERISKGVNSSGESVDKFSNDVDTLTTRLTKMVENLNQGASSVLSFGGSVDSFGKSIAPLSTSMSDLVSTQKQYVEQQKATVDAQTKSTNATDRMNAKLKEEVETMGMSRQEKLLYRAEQKGLTADNSEYVRSLQASINASKEEAAAFKSAAQIKREAKAAEAESARQTREDIQKNIEASRNLQAVNSQLAAHEKQMAEQRKASLKKDEEIAELRGLQLGYKGLLDDKKKDAEATRKSAEESKKQADEFAKLKASIDPVSAAYDKLDAQLDKISKLKSQGGGGVASVLELERLEDSIHKSRKQLDTLGATTGKTAKEMAFAMRGLPAQFTDVVVSLQGGQKPLTVLLQQGGQIKDMFGGIVPAFKSMGAYVLGLITPLNLAIAGIGALAYVAYSAHSDIENLRKSLILSGSATKATVGELVGGARRISESYGTVGKAAEVIGKVATTTKVHKDNIEAVTLATLKWRDATGGSVDDILGDFSKLDTASGLDEMQMKYSFLTLAIRESAEEARASGDRLKETAIYEKALADAMTDRANIARASSTGISAMYNNISEGAAKLFNTLKNGTAQFANTSDQVEFLERKKKDLELQVKLLDNTLGKLPDTMTNLHPSFISFDALLASLRSELEATEEGLRSLANEADRIASADYSKITAGLSVAFDRIKDPAFELEEALRKTNEQIKAIEESDQGRTEDLNKAIQLRVHYERQLYDLRENSLDNKLIEQSERALKMAKEQYSVNGKISSARLEYIRQEEMFAQIGEKLIAGVASAEEARAYANKEIILGKYEEVALLQEQYDASKKVNKETTKPVVLTQAQKMLKTLESQNAVLQEQLLYGRGMGTEAKNLAKLRQDIFNIEEASKTRSLTLDEQSLLNNKESLLLAQGENTELEKRIKIKQREVELEKFKQGLQESLITSKGGDTAREGFGVGDKEAGRIKERNELLKEEAKARRDIENARSLAREDGSYDEKEYDDKLAALDDYYGKRRGMLEEYYEVEDELQGDWLAGMQSGFETFLENQEDLYTTMRDMTEDLLTTLSEGISDSISNAIISGENLSDSMYKLGETIRNQLIKSLVEMAVQYSINAAAEILGIRTVAAVKRTEMATTATMAKTQTLANAGVQATAGATTAAAWSPAAIAASIGSFGAAAAVGLAAVVAAMAAFGGFKTGGYTGSMGVNDVAGVVHGQEYVFDAAATARIGVGNLERLRSGGDFQQGGGGGSVRGGRTTNVNQVINVSGEVDNRTANQISYETYSRQRRAEARFNR